jgi:hypothetical protein
MSIPSPFLGYRNHIGGSLSTLPEAMRFDHSKKRVQTKGEDRRLPVMHVMRVDSREYYQSPQREQRLDGWEHIQYLGEHMVGSYPFV